jgi:phytoene dehydrogenase-like protein
MKYEAIVIGAGPGGSCCAALLAASGLKTLIVEKNGYLGGKAGTVEQYGHRTDLFTHIPVLAMGRFGHLRRALESLGARERLELVEEMPTTLVCYGDTSVEYPLDYEAGEATLLSRMGLQMENPKEAVLQGLNLFLKTIKGFKPEDIEGMRDIPLGSFISSFPGALKDASDIASLLLFVVSAKYASTGETLEIMQRIVDPVPFPAGSLKEVADTWMNSLVYPQGGIGKVAELFVDMFMENGGELKLSSQADKIVVEGGAAKGVYVGGDFYQADAVVSNAGLQPTVLKLAGEEHFSSQYLDYVKSLRPSFGSARIRYFLDRQVTPHGLIVPYGGEEGGKAVEDEGRVDDETRKGKSEYTKPTKVGTMIVCTSNFDPGMSPPGKQVLIASCAATADYRFDVDRAAEWFKMIHAAVKSVIPDIEEHTEHIDYATSEDIARLSGRYGVVDGAGGECIGIAQIPGQVGKNRPDPVSPVEGLFYAGADTGKTGIGVDLAVGSGIDVAEMVQDYLAP